MNQGRSRQWLGAVVLTILLFASGSANAQPSLNERLTPYLERYGLPALAAAVVLGGEVIAAGAVGVRHAERDLPVTIHDRFHLGSDTKAMTALLAAMVVEDGSLCWGSTVSEVFPDLKDVMDPGFGRVTLEQLLSHTGGLPPDDEEFVALLKASLSSEGNLDEMRLSLLKAWCTRPLAAEPGTVFAYSNMGYVTAGAMVERVKGRTWDELIVERVFTPLGLETAGLGPQATLGRIDAPLGHAEVKGRIQAFLSGPNGDNPLIIGPAGIAHMSILDFARWAGWNAGEGKRGPALVRPETLKKLHTRVVTMPFKKDAAPGTPSRGGYGLGWGELEVAWAASRLLYHGGSNGRNLAHIWIDRTRDLAVVTATNISGPRADEALFALAPALYRAFAGCE